MAQESESRSLDKVIVRLPDGMRDALKDEAAAQNRSLNAEIVSRLEASWSRSDIGSAERALVQVMISDLVRAVSLPASEKGFRNSAKLRALLYLAQAPEQEITLVDGLYELGRKIGINEERKRIKADRNDLPKEIEAALADAMKRTAEFLRRNGWTVTPPSAPPPLPMPPKRKKD